MSSEVGVFDTAKNWARSLSRPLVGGVGTTVVSRRELADAVGRSVKEPKEPGRAVVVFATNGATISHAARNSGFRALLETADIVTPDGQSIVSGARWAGVTFPERVATTDLFLDVADISTETAVSHYLLGGEPGLAEECATILQSSYPGLSVVGTHHGYLKTVDHADLVNKINAAAPDVLWVGMGVPHEQEFVAKVRDQLKVRWIITCGGCFNYVTGAYPRAPMLMQRFGLEWLFRVLHDPRRLLWRYLATNPHAVWLMLTRTGEVR